MKNSFTFVFLRLRWRNLFITFLTLFVAYNFLLVPINDSIGLSLNLDMGNFFLLGLSTVLIMAGGYIINDWMDVESDAFNQKESGVRWIPRKMLFIYYTTVNLAALILAISVCNALNDYSLISIQIAAILLLLVYSTHLKSTPLAGNLIIAALCGIIPLLPLFYDRHSFLAQYDAAYVMLNFLSLFAFMSTLIRELAKDMEDEAGDRKANLATFPVIFGMQATKWTAFVFSLLFLLILGALLYLLAGRDTYSLLYLSIFAVAPMIYITYKLTKSESKQDFHELSSGLKWIMLAGALLPIVYYFGSL